MKGIRKVSELSFLFTWSAAGAFTGIDVNQ